MIQAQQAKQAASKLLAITEQQRNQALNAVADLLELQIPMILGENIKDVREAKQQQLSDALIDRLMLNEERLVALANSVREIAKQDQVVGILESNIRRDDGLEIHKQRVPIGVLAMIFESRPNVVIDCSALAIKSGNAIVLKGGKEATFSNRILNGIVQNAIRDILPEHSVQLVEQREDVAELLKQRGLIDLIIPRGGEGLVSFVEENSKVPVLAHHKGLCHTYIDVSANLDKAIDIVLNAKVQRPGVCNALETLLLDNKLETGFINQLFQQLSDAGVELRLDVSCPEFAGAKQASDSDWDEEYLDLILSVKMVDGVEKACDHIQQHGTNHTEVILANDRSALDYFQQHVDASAVMVNASSRFNDGGEFQLGAELGISTTKLHAYGPMGAKEMTICRHLVLGENHCRG